MSVIQSYFDGAIPLSRALEHYIKGGIVEELITAAKLPQGPKIPLYILSEIGRAAEPFWREALPYVDHEDYSVAHTALGLVHAYASESDYREIYDALTRTDLGTEALFAKAFAILLSKQKRPGLITKVLNHAIERDHRSVYVTGLALLCAQDHLTKDALRELLLGKDLVLKLIACCVVSNLYSKDKQMVMMMPNMAKEDMMLFKRRY